MAQDLGNKPIRQLHITDVASCTISDITSIVKSLVREAKIIDAVVVLDGSVPWLLDTITKLTLICTHNITKYYFDYSMEIKQIITSNNDK